MNRIFLIIDTSHMMHRVKHVTQGDIWTKTGLSLQIILRSVRKSWSLFNADHVVFCCDGRRGWRKAMFAPYKANRIAIKEKKTVQELEEDLIFFQAIDDFINFIDQKTNCTILQNELCEADDMIARWIHNHPNDQHVIVSGDSDFIQLLSENVLIYDGINNLIIKNSGVYDEEENRKEFIVRSSGKIKVATIKLTNELIKDPEDEWWKWALFLKLVRGDPGDNIFSAYPRVNINKVRKAYDDRIKQGYDWNNFMLSRWTDHKKNDHRVKDCFERNQNLIDLTKQPDEIKEIMDNLIIEAKEAKIKTQVGIHLLKFAGKYELLEIAKHPNDFSKFLSMTY